MPESLARTFIFGYGSLIHPASANTTLGRSQAPSPFPTATLRGYSRGWDYVTSMRLTGVDKSHPARGVALNIVAEENASCNGVLIAVSQDELERLDARESGYDRFEVSDRITFADKTVPAKALIYTYVGRPEKRILPPGAFIPQRYLAVVREGIGCYGQDFSEAFDKTTHPHDLPIAQAVYPNDPTGS